MPGYNEALLRYMQFYLRVQKTIKYYCLFVFKFYFVFLPGALTKTDAIESIMKYMTIFIDCDERVVSALVALNKLFIYQNCLNMKTEDKELVLSVMKNHLRGEKIQFVGFQLLLKLVSKCELYFLFLKKKKIFLCV